MNLLLIKDSTTSINIGFLKYFLDFLTQYRNFAVTEIAKDSIEFDTNKSQFFWINAPTNKLEKVWFNKVKLNSLISKYHIDQVIVNSFAFPINTAKKIAYIIQDRKQIETPIFQEYLHNNSAECVVYSDQLAKQIQEKNPNCICKILYPLSEISALNLSWDEQQTIKEKYSEGEEYFFVNCINQPLENTLQILKGFSILKKWQKSNIKLLLLVDSITNIQNSLSNYKYRNDVQLVNAPDETEISRIIGSAYCTIDLNNLDSELAFFKNSIMQEIPCLVTQNCTASQTIENKTFLVEKIDVDEIGKAFITIYKAEYLRAEYMESYKTITENWRTIIQNQINDFQL